MGVDRVIAERPGDAGGVKQQRRRRQLSRDRRIAHERPPVEGKAEPGLRPPGDSLHERIGGDQRQRRDAKEDRIRIELQQRQQADGAEKGEKRPCPPDADLAGRYRPQGGARDFRVEIAIDDVVIGAARAAHDEGADREQNGEGKTAFWRGAGPGRGEGKTLPARNEQQPCPDRPVRAHQAQIGLRRVGREAINPVVGGGVGGRCGHFSHSCVRDVAG